ncbi:MAG: ATP-binding cassette domain-containing protein [Rectinema sp.]
MENFGILSTEGVTKRFGDFTAVDGVDFCVSENESIGIIGPNGAGKTTFLNLLTGHYAPEEGAVRFRGQDITSVRAEKRVSMGLVRTFQIVHVFDNLSVYDNLAMAYFHKREAKRWPIKMFFVDFRANGDIRGHVERALEEFDMTAMRNTMVGSLALGSKKKLEIAMAWIADPAVLLLDEPFAGIGDHEIDEIILVIQKIRHQKTSIIVEHKLSKLSQIVDKLAVMSEGKIIGFGQCEDTLNSAEVRKSYWKLTD